MALALINVLKRLSPLRESRATPENPQFNLSDPAAWDAVLGGDRDTDAGVPVNHESALTYSPVWQAVTMIAGDVAKLPLDLYRRLEGDDREVDKTHPAYNLVRFEPNDDQTADIFWEQMMAHVLLWRNAYAFIERDGAGNPTALMPLLPDRTAPERHKGQLLYLSEINGRLEAFFPSEIFHLRGTTTQDLAGCDLVDKARHAIALGLASIKFASKFFRHGGRVGGILELPATMGKGARDNVEEGFRRSYEGADNPFRTVVLRENAKFHQAQATLQDSQLIEARQESVRDVARYFNLAPSRLGVEDGSSYKSKEEDRQSYLDRTLDIWLVKIHSQSRHKLLTPRQRRDDSHYFEHNTGALLRTNIEARFRTYAIGIRNRIINPNEARKKENMRPYEGGDEFLVPPGMGLNSDQAGEGNTDSGQSGNQPENPAEPAEPADDAARAAPHQANLRRRVVYNITARARHKAAKPAGYLEWIDGNLASHRREAAELLGAAADDLIDPLLRDLAEAAESASADELPAAVDRVCTSHELSL